MKFFKILPLFAFIMLLIGCNSSEEKSDAQKISKKKATSKTVEPRVVSEEFKDYWYSGTAEITSYTLMQERYGEIREGTAVNIFVSEDFLPDAQVKANNASEKKYFSFETKSNEEFQYWHLSVFNND
jgi:hypothetical protein